MIGPFDGGPAVPRPVLSQDITKSKRRCLHARADFKSRIQRGKTQQATYLRPNQTQQLK